MFFIKVLLQFRDTLVNLHQTVSTTPLQTIHFGFYSFVCLKIIQTDSHYSEKPQTSTTGEILQV